MASLELEAKVDNLLATAQAETANIDLFAPILEREECPICMIPLPIDEGEIRFMSCCGKYVCQGCSYKQALNDKKNGVPNHKKKCAFCRQPPPSNSIKALRKLMKKNNPDVYIQMSKLYKSGGNGMLQSDTKSLEMLIKAAELGNNYGCAYYMIGLYYRDGIAVEQDEAKTLDFWRIAAKKGSLRAHKNLAHSYSSLPSFLESGGDIQKCIEHLEMAASAGEKDCMDTLMVAYKDKLLSKEDLTQTLRAFQTSNDAMNSKDRDDARVVMRKAGM